MQNWDTVCLLVLYTCKYSTWSLAVTAINCSPLYLYEYCVLSSTNNMGQLWNLEHAGITVDRGIFIRKLKPSYFSLTMVAALTTNVRKNHMIRLH